MRQQQLITEPFNYLSVGPGFFFLGIRELGRWQQEPYPLVTMHDVIRAVNRKKDTFISQGEFYGRNRRLVTLSRVGVLWAEMDYYKTLYEIHRPGQMTHIILNHCENEGIPIPSYVFFSGRGLYLKWLLDKPIPGKAYPRWIAVQRNIAVKLSHFGADTAIDGSRVLSEARMHSKYEVRGDLQGHLDESRQGRVTSEI